MIRKQRNKAGMVSVEILMIIAVGAIILVAMTKIWNSEAQPRAIAMARAVLGHKEDSQALKRPNHEDQMPLEDDHSQEKDEPTDLIDKLNQGSEKLLNKLLGVLLGPKDPEELKRHWYERLRENEEGIRKIFGDEAIDDPSFVFDPKVLKERGFDDHPQTQNLAHNNKGNFDNVKWTRKRNGEPFGDIEIILDKNGRLVTDPRLLGTYNFGSSTWKHFIKDVVPYIAWGNSPDDPSSAAERLTRMEDGFHLGLREKAKTSPTTVKKINDVLWKLYDKGYLPRQPRMPRYHQFQLLK